MEQQTQTIYLGGALADGTDGAAQNIELLPKIANRHGIITGATGTGKTVTLQVLAEGFSRIGVPVFTADVKGDLSGLAAEGTISSGIEKRVAALGIEGFQTAATPSCFWDLYGECGHPLRTTISEFGPLLLSHALDLNETQEGVMHIAFRAADDEGLLLLDLKDLRSLLQWLAEHREEIASKYGNASPQSIAAIQRRLLVLEEAGADHFFGEPAFKIDHLFRCSESGKGIVNVLHAAKLMQQPRLYSTFLLWLLAELFEELPEKGDPEKPELVFFFDEAHLLFEHASSALQDKIEQVVRLIRSKGVGVYFVTQHPDDVPDKVLSQLGNRVQHALRAYTPREQKALKAASEAFRENPAFDTKEAITALGTGEALVSLLDAKGVPQMVERVLVSPPSSRIGPLTDEERSEKVRRSVYAGIYDDAVDRESAHELLQERAKKAAEAAEKAAADEAEAKEKARASRRQGPVEAFVKSVLRSIGSSIGRQVARGVLGSLKR